ncbi:unnamed protein product [Adineta steineri]|uniref:Uncharacterized protein n=1 Tax=Adineta steineri TaxID=433720 RepID=A0A815DWX2_9BILA|nr:unnamed protein product [Adineta steineri]
MTNNVTGKIGNNGNIVYDTGNEIHHGNQRVGTSATEIELLDDIPPPIGAGKTTAEHNVSDRARVSDTQAISSSIDKQQQQQQQQSNNYHTLSLNRAQPTAHVVYQDENDQQLGSAVDKLLQKYAPDAMPQHLPNKTTSRQPPAQSNISTAYDQPILSSFQTNTQPSATTAHNYSTVIRPNTGSLPQSPPQMNNNMQSSTYPRASNNYNNFQHNIPQPQQQQQQPQSKPAVTIKTKNNQVTQVVPGKLYTLDDDPLHLLFDKQNPVSSNSYPSVQQPSSFQSTFQPSANNQNIQDPLSSLFTNTSQRYPQQSGSITTDSNPNGMHPFDLGNLIKRVQEDYLREIQPFVSSVKFVEKDKEFGQNLNDIGFTTPVTVRKGFTRQADDILRRSFGTKGNQQKSANRYESNDYSDYDDDIRGIRTTDRQNPLKKFDSKQSFTSVTSASTHDSDYDDQNISLNTRKKRANVHDQGTSPPPKLRQTNTQSQVQRSSGTTATKFAKRISSGPRTSSPGSESSNSHDDYTATYNEHEPYASSRGNPSESIGAIATKSPLVQVGNAGARDRNTTSNQGQQRSEDIHPTPPTIRPPPNSQTLKRNDSQDSDISSRSDQVSESDDEPPPPPKPVTSAAAAPAPTARDAAANKPATGRDAVAAAGAPTARDAAASKPATGRDAVAAAGAPTARDAAASKPATGRDAVAAAGAPTARDAAASKPATGRDAVAAAGAPTARDAAASKPATGRDAVAAAGAPAPTARDAAASKPATGRDAVAAAGAPAPTARDAAASKPATGRDAVAAAGAPAPTARDAANNKPAGAPAPTARDAANNKPAGAPAPTARDAANNKPAGAPAPTARDAANNKPAGAPASTARDAAGATPAAASQGATGTAASTGSTRLFHTDGDNKGKRSIKDAPAAFGNKLKALFQRK